MFSFFPLPVIYMTKLQKEKGAYLPVKSNFAYLKSSIFFGLVANLIGLYQWHTRSFAGCGALKI